MVVRISDKKKNYSKVTKLLVKPKCFIEKGVPEQNIHIDYISSVIAVHTGLGCIAIQYIREEN